MKSSPKLNEISPSTGPKTPASGKKLVQARLPFKTLGGSEPPVNDAPDTSLDSANTLAPAIENRKRKQSTSAVKDEGIRAAKVNRSEMANNDSITGIGTTEAMQSDFLADSETNNGTKAMHSPNSESKENCKELVDKVESANCAPKAKQSLEFGEEQPEPRKSKRNESSFMIKLPISKKTKKTRKPKMSESIDLTKMDVSMDEVDTENINMDIDTTKDAESDGASSSMVQDEPSDNETSSNVGNVSILNDSIVSNASDRCITPVKMTPKQLQRRNESEKKKQEKELAKIEKERKLQDEKEQRQREKEERELQRKREREEKDEQRRKEKEMREQKMLEEKLEKQREKEQKEQQRKIEREEKEEQRKREKEERELQKKKEREDKEREKEEERKKKDEEKRQKIEAEQNKNRKTVEAFAKFFVPKKIENKTDLNENDDKLDFPQVSPMFMSFQVKEDMKMAPVARRTLNDSERSTLEEFLTSSNSSVDLYLTQIKSSSFIAKKTMRTWQEDEDDKCSNADDLFIIEEDGQGVQLIKEEPKKLYRAKFFKFSENRRPPFYGTWRKKSDTVRSRKPFGLDSRLDYEVDSDDEWEEEEPGESLEHGSDDENEVDSEDEYEIDNEFFVPHGHLSDEELQNEDEPDFNDPENVKFKLKLAQNEFEDERKKKTQKLKPHLIGPIWQNSDGLKPENCSTGVWELVNKHALLFNGPSVKVGPTTQQAENSDDENTNGKPLGVRRLQIGEKEVPDLIRLINGNQNSCKFLVKEFCAYLAKNHQPQREYASASITAKIKELATWQSCPEENSCMYRKMCWYVPISTRKRYDLNDLTFPNTWSYTIPPRRNPVGLNEVEVESKATENFEVEKKTDLADIIAVSDDSNSCTLSETLTPELIKQASSKRQNYNIAKFIRPLTQDEKKKQFEPITLNRRSSEDQMTEKESNDTPPMETKCSSAPKLKTTLVTQFLSNNVRKRKSNDINNDITESSPTSTAGTSDGAKKSKLNPSIIVID